MARKKTEKEMVKAVAAPAPPGSAERAGRGKNTETPASPRKRTPRVKAEPASRSAADMTSFQNFTEPRFQAILGELRSVKRLVQDFAPKAVGKGSDAALEGSVDSLRRLLSELIEERMEAVVRDVARVRGDAAALPGRNGARIVEQLDTVLDNLGALRFQAEPMDLVDPLIHAVAEERHRTDAPDGVILETVRPGYRTGRGVVVCKATVAVNRRP